MSRTALMSGRAVERLCTRRFLACVVAIASSAGCSASKSDVAAFEANIPLHPVTGEPAAITLYCSGGGLSPASESSDRELIPLIVAVRSDGSIAWTSKSDGAGKPYLVAKKPEEEVASLVARLQGRIDACPPDHRTYCVPDAACKTLTLLDGERLSGLESCIELFEYNPSLVATDNGIESLEGRDREAVLAAQSAAHREFRGTWKECVDSVRAAIPSEGEPSSHTGFDYVHWHSRKGRQGTIPR